MKKCDLHTHSLFSDGSYSPEQIIQEAKELDLVVALTDHNTVEGLPSFLKEGERLGVTAVPGVELSTEYDGDELHLLGLFIAPEYYEKVERLVKEIQVEKEICNMEMVERLCEAGYVIDYFDVKRRNPSGNVNRAHIAVELLEKGYIPSIYEGFATILADDGGFYVPPRHLDTADSAKFLREIKAIPILAHPLKDISEERLREILPALIKAGLLGIETHHSSYSEEKIQASIKIAEEFSLFKSGGSDFHGEAKPGIFLGKGSGNLDIPLDVYNTIHTFYKNQ